MPETSVVMDGARAWEEVRAVILATEAAGRRPSWRFLELRPLLKAELDRLRAGHAEQSRVFVGEVAQAYGVLLDRVDKVSLAGTLIQAEYERQEAPRRTVTELARRVYELRGQGMRALSILEAMGRVSEEKAASIRRGAGHMDAASDLLALAPVLTEHWEVLAPIQQGIADESARLTEAGLKAMSVAATELIEADRAQRAPVTGTDWYDALRRATVRLTVDWDRLRLMSAGSLAALDRMDQALDVRPGLLALYRGERG